MNPLNPFNALAEQLYQLRAEAGDATRERMPRVPSEMTPEVLMKLLVPDLMTIREQNVRRADQWGERELMDALIAEGMLNDANSGPDAAMVRDPFAGTSEEM